MINLNLLSAHLLEQSEDLAEDSKNLRITTDEFREANNALVTKKYEKRLEAMEEGQFQ